MARRSAEDTAITRQNVLDAALSVFAESGCSGATLEMIACRAGVSRGAVYWHFKGRAALLAELLEAQRLPMEVFESEGLDLGLAIDRLQVAVQATLRDPDARRLCELLLHKSERTQEGCLVSLRLEKVQVRFGRQVENMLLLAAERGQLVAGIEIPATLHFLKISFMGLMFECLRAPAKHKQHLEATMDWLRTTLVAKAGAGV
ncbi:TetR family transcriptional regulator [Pseudomonas abieticivorans]|uniref:TetR family transcriptional regulator n=1 Tax=Pseudomonas abieticivorans TaxID=2931382 RepID=UPI0020BF84BC|nr:TetR family transcriptional regulator [Pseudomonas sp. PIA16]